MSRVEFKFVTQDGLILDESEVTPEQKQAVAQRIMDNLIVPAAYEAVLKEIQLERQVAAIDNDG